MSQPKRADCCTSTHLQLHAYFFLSYANSFFRIIHPKHKLFPQLPASNPKKKVSICTLMIKVNLTKNRTARERRHWEGTWSWAATGKLKERRHESTAYRSKKHSLMNEEIDVPGKNSGRRTLWSSLKSPCKLWSSLYRQL